MFFSPDEIKALLQLVDEAVEEELDGPFEAVQEKLLDYQRGLAHPDEDSPMSETVAESLIEHLSAVASMAYSGDVVAYGFAIHLDGEDTPSYGHFNATWPLASGLDAARAIVLSKLIAGSQDLIPDTETH